jgi:hypothetical protein
MRTSCLIEDGKSTLRLVDIMVYMWVGEKHACMDNHIAPSHGD